MELSSINDMKKGLNEFLSKIRQVEVLKNIRVKFLLSLLACAAVFSIFLNLIYKPQNLLIQKLKEASSSYENRAVKIKSQSPDVARERELLEKEELSLSVLSTELSQLESHLPHQDSLPSLLKEIFKDEYGRQLEFHLTRPVPVANESKYTHMNMEMKIHVDFLSYIKFLCQLEQYSHFMKINKIAIEEKEKDGKAYLEVDMILSALLGTLPSSGQELAAIKKKPAAVFPQIKRNPFVSGEDLLNPLSMGDEYRISGIISSGLHPTVIINDEVYKSGDHIGNDIIRDILKGQVVLERAGQQITLYVDE